MRRIERRSGNASILPTLVILGLIFFGLRTVFSNSNVFPQIFLTTVLIFCLAFLSLIFAFSFFTVPLKEPADLFKLLQRLILFTLHLHGPIQFVKNGRPEIIHAGFSKNYPGFIWLDSASAAIISRTTSYHRVVGPGICFTQKDEFISKAICLSPQKKWVGPFEDEEPFSSQGKKESWEDYQSRINRADKTTAFTMDGKKIIASFLLEFKLDAAAGEGGCPYGFNPIAVKKAALSQPMAARNSFAAFVEEWSDLPGILVADVWKEFIGHHKLEEVISKENNALNDFLKDIQDCIAGTKPQKMKSATWLEPIHQLKNQRGIALKEIHLMQIIFENSAIQATRFQEMKEFSSIEMETFSENIEKEKTDTMNPNQPILGNMLAGMINELSAKGKLSYESLSKKLNQQLKTLAKQ